MKTPKYRESDLPPDVERMTQAYGLGQEVGQRDERAAIVKYLQSLYTPHAREIAELVENGEHHK